MAKKQFCAVCKSDSPKESMQHCDKCKEAVTGKNNKKIVYTGQSEYDKQMYGEEKLKWYDTWGYTFDNERRSPKKTPKSK